MTAEGEDVWQAIVSSIVSGQNNQNEDLLSPEDKAWIDSCLVKDAELSDSGWDALKDALLDIISSEPATNSNASTAEYNGFARGTGDDIVEMEMGEEVGSHITGGTYNNLVSLSLDAENAKFQRDISENRKNDPMTEKAETGQFRGYLRNELPNFHDKKEDKDAESSSSLGLSNEIEFLSENIFTVWDLATSVVEEDDVVKQLENALAESPLQDLPSTLDYTVPGTDNEKLDNLIANMASLSLNSF